MWREFQREFNRKLSADFSRQRFAGLPLWLQVSGWIGVSAAVAMVAFCILFLPALAAYVYSGPRAEWLFLSVPLLGFYALALGPPAHLLVHNPWRREPCLAPWSRRHLYVSRLIWLTGLAGYLGMILPVVLISLAVAGLANDMLFDFFTSDWEKYFHVSGWMLAAYFGIYYFVASLVAGVQAKPPRPPAEPPAPERKTLLSRKYEGWVGLFGCSGFLLIFIGLLVIPSQRHARIYEATRNLTAEDLMLQPVDYWLIGAGAVVIFAAAILSSMLDTYKDNPFEIGLRRAPRGGDGPASS